MKPVYTKQSPQLRIVPKDVNSQQSMDFELKVRDLGPLPGEVCDCGVRIHLIVDRYGHYDLHCGECASHKAISTI